MQYTSNHPIIPSSTGGWGRGNFGAQATRLSCVHISPCSPNVKVLAWSMAWFIASQAIPPVIAPSPITAMLCPDLRGWSHSLAATGSADDCLQSRCLFKRSFAVWKPTAAPCQVFLKWVQLSNLWNIQRKIRKSQFYVCIMNYECILYVYLCRHWPDWDFRPVKGKELAVQASGTNPRETGRQPSIGLISMYSKHAVPAQVPVLGLKVLRSQTPNSKTCNLPVWSKNFKLPVFGINNNPHIPKSRPKHSSVQCCGRWN